MNAWVLILVFVHADGVHSIKVEFASQFRCEEAAAQWKRPHQFDRIRYVEARCHKT